jgi:long-subunit acyl-CoA synthetase (AMP-forming)
VGGAPVSPRLLAHALQLGVPAFEGYGLSECASVVSLNSPSGMKRGSLGKPLPHVRLSFSDKGEILVGGGNFLGYLGEKPPAEPWPTGDLGHLDEQGFLHLAGRKKSMFITSFGRNVSPEWVEGELTFSPAIAQAAVFGEARPFNVAVLTPAAGADAVAVQGAVDDANTRLPDYARIHQWIAAEQPFAVANQQLTANGRLKRESIRSAYLTKLESLYQEEMNVVL